MNSNFMSFFLVLTVIGAINWGLLGLFNFNLVQRIFGTLPTVTRVIYIVVGISGLITLYSYLISPINHL